MKIKLLVLLLVIGLLSACGSQATEAPASPATEESIPATEAPTDPPPPTDTVVPTETALQPTDATAAASVSFANEILPLVRSRCSTCHGGNQGTEEGLDLTTYENIMAGSDNGPVVIAGDAENSLLVQLLLENKMPKRGPKLAPPQVQLIIDWINRGALNN
jgi:hypothetical protein